MKKILVLILGVFLGSQAFCQTDKGESVNVVTDSLSLAVANLQHDYNFLYCDYSINKLILSVSTFNNNLGITSSDISDYFHRHIYDNDLYLAYSNNYDASCKQYDTYKEEYVVLNRFIFLKISTSNFSEKEVNLLKAGLTAIQAGLNRAESGLNLYNVSLKAYRSIKYD